MTSSRLSHWLGSTAGPADLPQADCDLIESRRELMLLGGNSASSSDYYSSRSPTSLDLIPNTWPSEVKLTLI